MHELKNRIGTNFLLFLFGFVRFQCCICNVFNHKSQLHLKQRNGKNKCVFFRKEEEEEKKENIVLRDGNEKLFPKQ